MINSGWKKLSIKDGYQCLRRHNFSKVKSAYRAVKGVKVYSVSFGRRK